MPGNTQQLLGTISNALTGLMGKVNAVQSDMYDVTLKNIQSLEYDVNGRLIQNTANTKVLATLKNDLDKQLRSRNYTNAVRKFGLEYNVLETLQNNWFAGLVDDFKPSGATQTAKRTAIKQMVDNLVGGGTNQAVTQQAGNLLLRNMQTGATRRQVNDGLRTFMIGNKSVPGRLQAYTGQIAVDSINQYARSYAQQVSEDLGFEWYQYVGRVKDTTRPFCAAMVKQRYIHKSELAKASVGELRIGKVSTEGMYKNTNSKNIITVAGGYDCGHQFRPVATKNVPLKTRESVTGKEKKVEAKVPGVKKPQVVSKPITPKQVVPDNNLEKMTNAFTPAKDSKEAIFRIKEAYNKKAFVSDKDIFTGDIEKMELSHQNAILFAVEKSTILPRQITTVKKVMQESGRSFSYPANISYGVHLNGKVGINTTTFKTTKDITEAKIFSDKRWMNKNGHKFWLNTDGKTTAIHEFGHVFDSSRGRNFQHREWDVQIHPEWIRHSKIGHINTPSEAWADAYADYYVNNGSNLPDYVNAYVDAKIKSAPPINDKTVYDEFFRKFRLKMQGKKVKF